MSSQMSWEISVEFDLHSNCWWIKTKKKKIQCHNVWLDNSLLPNWAVFFFLSSIRQIANIDGTIYKTNMIRLLNDKLNDIRVSWKENERASKSNQTMHILRHANIIRRNIIHNQTLITHVLLLNMRLWHFKTENANIFQNMLLQDSILVLFAWLFNKNSNAQVTEHVSSQRNHILSLMTIERIVIIKNVEQLVVYSTHSSV